MDAVFVEETEILDGKEEEVDGPERHLCAGPHDEGGCKNIIPTSFGRVASKGHGGGPPVDEGPVPRW